MLELYTDGSFNPETGVYGGAVIIVNDGEILGEYSTSGDRPEYAKSRNIAGEVMAAIFGLKIAYEAGQTAVKIIYDCEQIGCWIEGTSRRKKPISLLLHAAAREYDGKMKIECQWTKAHAGHTYNELADRLAKKACGIR